MNSTFFNNVSCQAHQPTLEWEHCQLHQVHRTQHRVRRNVRHQAHRLPHHEAELHGWQLWSYACHVTGAYFSPTLLLNLPPRCCCLFQTNEQELTAGEGWKAGSAQLVRLMTTRSPRSPASSPFSTELKSTPCSSRGGFPCSTRLLQQKHSTKLECQIVLFKCMNLKNLSKRPPKQKKYKRNSGVTL